MSYPSLPGSWDCHVHCFEPEKFPYRSSRTYTPRPAPLDKLIRALLTDNVVIVQASIEPEFESLLAHLEECRSAPHHLLGRVRGTVLAADAGASLSSLSDGEIERMHTLGVRCIRLHGSHGGSGHDLEWAQNQLRALAQLKPVLKYSWSIAAQLPLHTWSQLKDFILTDEHLATVSIIADHIACAVPSDHESTALEDFIQLLQSGRVYVKISALHRRSPHNIHAMKPIVSLLAQVAPHALLWGSDWPHVDATQNEYETGPLEGVDASNELAVVRSWLSDGQCREMLIGTPELLFGC